MLYGMSIILIMFLILELYLYQFGKKQDDVECDFMIILGAGLHGDKLSSALKRRLDQALVYAQKYPKVLIVVSGGQGPHETISEAYAMKQYLVAQGIEKSRIVKEDRSTSTYTNFLYTHQLLDARMHTVMITSCDFHMYRACRIAKRLGYVAYRNPARSNKIKCIKYYIREGLCVLKNWILNT